MLSDDMTAWLPNQATEAERTFYTVCYLTLPTNQAREAMVGTQHMMESDPDADDLFNHTAFRQVIDPDQLVLTDNARLRFSKTMKRLNLKVQYHLSEMEPFVQHPIQDERLLDICSCYRHYCDASPDHKSWDKPYFVQNILEERSEGS